MTFDEAVEASRAIYDTDQAEVMAAFAAMKEERDAALAVLREVEWIGDYHSGTCVLCHGFKPHGHEQGCAVAAVLAMAEVDG